MSALQELIIPSDEWWAIRATLSEPEPLGGSGLKVRTSSYLPDGWIGAVDLEGNLTLYRPEPTESQP